LPGVSRRRRIFVQFFIKNHLVLGGFSQLWIRSRGTLSCSGNCLSNCRDIHKLHVK
jgi:hypothetical protein